MTSNFKCPNNHTLCTEIFDGMKKAKSDGTPTKCGVSVIVINDNDEILLGFDKNKNHWSFFSGSMDGNDINENAGVKEACLCEVAIRELKEEAGINIDRNNFIEYIGGDNIKNISNKKEDCNPFFVLKIKNDSIDVKKINKILAAKQDKKNANLLLPAYKEIVEIQYFNRIQLSNLGDDSIYMDSTSKQYEISNFVNNQMKDSTFGNFIADLSPKIADKLNSFSVDEAIEESEKKAAATATTLPQDTTKKQTVTTNANPDIAQVKTTTTEGTILYVDLTSTNNNMKVSMIKLNDNFKKYTKKNGIWIEDTSKGGNKRKSKPTKKARRSK